MHVAMHTRKLQSQALHLGLLVQPPAPDSFPLLRVQREAAEVQANDCGTAAVARSLKQWKLNNWVSSDDATALPGSQWTGKSMMPSSDR